MKKTKTILAGAAAAAVLGFDRRPEITHYEIASPRLPEDFCGFRLAHISDYHNGAPESVSGLIRNEQPDAIMLTGDMTNEHESYAPAIRFLKSLCGIAPCYLISGNHDIVRADYPDYVKACEEAGAVFLQNERIWIYRRDSRIAVSGMEDLFYKTPENMKKRFDACRQELGNCEEFEILLFHRANLLDWLADSGSDLILAGHLHGGQIRIPGLGGILCPRSSLAGNSKVLFPPYTGGLYRIGAAQTPAIVSRGLGNPIPIPRLFNRPEIGIVTLV